MKFKGLIGTVCFVATLSLFSAAVVAATLEPPHFEQDGVTNDETAAQFLQKLQLLQGGDYGDLMLDQNLTREQMMVIASRFLDKENEARGYSVSEMTFKDVPLSNEYAHYVAWAEANGITQGYSSEKFGFGDKVTYWQAEAFIVRILGNTNVSDDMVPMEFSDDLFGNEFEGGGFNLENFDAFSLRDYNSSIPRKHMATYMYYALYASPKDNLTTTMGQKLDLFANNEGVYTNKKLGFSITLPESWKGKYIVIKQGERCEIGYKNYPSYVLNFFVINRIDKINWSKYQEYMGNMDYVELGSNDKFVFTAEFPMVDVAGGITDSPEAVKAYRILCLDEENILKTFKIVDNYTF